MEYSTPMYRIYTQFVSQPSYSYTGQFLSLTKKNVIKANTIILN